jgi:hypothetical protein
MNVGIRGLSYPVAVRLPRDRILDWQPIDQAKAAALDMGSTPEAVQVLEQQFLIRLLLVDEHGRLPVEVIDEEGPRLLELGTVVARPFEVDPSRVRLSFRPASPALSAIRPGRTRGRANRQQRASRKGPDE